MALKEGMIVKVKHPEVSPNVEWIVVRVEQVSFTTQYLYELKATGGMSQTLLLPSSVQFEAQDNTLPPVLAPMTGMSVGNSYHQDRRLVKRIIDGVYTTTLVKPKTEYPLGRVAAASWEKAIREEAEQKLHAFKRDLREVCGTRKRNNDYGWVTDGLRTGYRDASYFDDDFLEAQKLWRKEAGGPGGFEMRYDTWITYMGLYACYRKVLEAKE